MIAEYNEWMRQVSEKLAVFAGLDIGYPKGDNCVLPPLHGSEGSFDDLGLDDEGRSSLRAFYAVCDGFNFPDVGEGIFVVGRMNVGSARDAYVPIRVDGQDWGVLAIGTFGDGSYIVMRTDTGEIMRLPPSKIRDSVYYENPMTPVQTLASNLKGFLDSVARTIPVKE